MSKETYTLLGVIAYLGIAPCAFAQAIDPPEHAPLMRLSSGKGNAAFLAAGIIIPALRGDKEHSLRTADALATGLMASQVLKLATRERRPDGSTHDSFPSGHATAAFAVASMQSARERPYWYAGATLIAISRVTLDRHYTHDVVAGALLGIYAAQEAQRHPHGLLLRPIFSRRGMGLSVTRPL